MAERENRACATMGDVHMDDVEGLAKVDMRMFDEESSRAGAKKMTADELQAQLQARENEMLRVEQEEAEQKNRNAVTAEEELHRVLDEMDATHADKVAALQRGEQMPEEEEEKPKDEADWRLMFPVKMPPPLYDGSIPWDGRDPWPDWPATGRLPPENPPEKEKLQRGSVDVIIDWCQGKEHLRNDTAELIVANRSGNPVETPEADYFYPLENYVMTHVGPSSGPVPDWLDFPEPESVQKGVPQDFTPHGQLRYDGVGVRAA